MLAVARTRDGTTAPCPDGGVSARRVHSRYQHHLADAALGGRSVAIELCVRRMFCDTADRTRRTSAEQDIRRPEWAPKRSATPSSDDNCPGHQMTLRDREAGASYRKFLRKYGEADVREKLRERRYERMVTPNRAIHLFVGDIAAHSRTFMLLGPFHPERSVVAGGLQEGLFSLWTSRRTPPRTAAQTAVRLLPSRCHYVAQPVLTHGSWSRPATILLPRQPPRGRTGASGITSPVRRQARTPSSSTSSARRTDAVINHSGWERARRAFAPSHALGLRTTGPSAFTKSLRRPWMWTARTPSEADDSRVDRGTVHQVSRAPGGPSLPATRRGCACRSSDGRRDVPPCRLGHDTPYGGAGARPLPPVTGRCGGPS
ncbi:hypothetical protein SAMN05428939_1668 [Streptomyces sp. TLI_105]|nr:hypothetical protein SAMN05428939_1668 [Streptomyces sp. TLI_105]